MKFKLDKKDIEILKILDRNFRTQFSAIGKKVGLDKNSVRLRFQKLKEIMSHNTAGINNKILGYALVKIFYSIDYFDKNIEEKIIDKLKKHPKVAYAARHYGHYNLEIALFVKDFDELDSQISIFNEKFSKIISKKEIEIVVKEFFFGNNFLYDNNLPAGNVVEYKREKKVLDKADHKIISILVDNPRESIIEISNKTYLSPKTVISHMKAMEKSGIISGYFMMLDYSKFGLNPFKILIQTSNLAENDKFEKHLSSIKNVKHFSRLLGFWDYEIDMLYGSILELQEQIEILKHLFPNHIKKIEIVSHGKRILTNRRYFL